MVVYTKKSKSLMAISEIQILGPLPVSLSINTSFISHYFRYNCFEVQWQKTDFILFPCNFPAAKVFLGLYQQKNLIYLVFNCLIKDTKTCKRKKELTLLTFEIKIYDHVT